MKAQEAKAKRNGYYKPPPPTAEEQARLTLGFNLMLEKLKAMNHPIAKHAQLQLI